MNLDGKVVMVTGGASGLGEATVRAMRSRGARVVIVDRSREAGEALATELGSSAIFAGADITSEGDVTKAIAQAKSVFGGLSVVVNCAGIGSAGRVLGKEGPMPLELFAMTVNVNLVGTFNVARLAADAMQRNEPGADGERGVLILTASIAAFDGQIGQVPYAAAKAGVVGMTLPMARELARFGIRVVTIAPGTFDTPMLAGLPEPARVALAQGIPFPPRLGKPNEFAALAVHIAENAMLNGETIRLDGALRMPPK